MVRDCAVDRSVLSLDALGTLFDGMADGVYVVDAGQRVRYWNRAAERITGVSSESVLGRRCFDGIAGTDFTGRCYCRQDCATILCARRGEAVPSYDVLARPGERRIWVNVSILPACLSGFDEPVAVHIFRDVTKPHMAEVLADETIDAVSRYAEAVSDHRSREQHLEQLTPRELEVLRLLASGATVRGIAMELVITRATVRAHIEHLMARLGAHSRLQAVVIAAKRGLL